MSNQQQHKLLAMYQPELFYSNGPQETLKPMQSQNAYVRKFSDKEAIVTAKKSGELNK